MLIDEDVLPSHGSVTFLSDYIEFRALCSTDKCFTVGELSSLLSGRRDDSSQKWVSALNLVKSRKNYFGVSYPFSVPEDKNDVILLNGDLQNTNKMYLSLLICSSLKYIDRARVNSLAREFEKFSKQVFQYLLPKGATIKPNWANPDPEEDCYRGHLADKFRDINQDIRCSSPSTVRREDFDEHNTGDGGIDIVAWHEMHDEREGIPIAVGQCSCTTGDWDIKQIESTYTRYSKYFPLVHPWSNYYFCPLDLRKSNSKWYLENKIGGAIVVDRSRFVNFMLENEDNIELSCLHNFLDL